MGKVDGRLVWEGLMGKRMDPAASCLVQGTGDDGCSSFGDGHGSTV